MKTEKKDDSKNGVKAHTEHTDIAKQKTEKQNLGLARTMIQKIQKYAHRHTHDFECYRLKKNSM